MRTGFLLLTVLALLLIGAPTVHAQQDLAERDPNWNNRAVIGLPGDDDEGPDVPKQVEVVNFPETQHVAGAVEVTNLPAVQPVTGSVAVSNFPPMFPVSGAVAVTNLPDTQNVNGTVDVGNFPAVQPVTGAVEVSNLGDVQMSGAVEVTNFPAGQEVTGTVDIGNLPTTQNVVGVIDVGNFPTDETGAILVSPTGCNCQPESLVVEMIHEYQLGHDEEFISEAIDLLPYFGGRIILQLVVAGEHNVNADIYATARWTVDEYQTVGYDETSTHVQLYATTSIDGGADAAVGETMGRFLKIRLRIHGNGATASVYVMATK